MLGLVLHKFGSNPVEVFHSCPLLWGNPVNGVPNTETAFFMGYLSASSQPMRVQPTTLSVSASPWRALSSGSNTSKLATR